MKRRTGMAVAVAILGALAANITVSEAAVPKVAGKYAVMGWDLCQARFFSNFDNFSRPDKPVAPAVTSIEAEIDGNGIIRARVGVVTFPSTASSSGQASASFVLVQGAATKINHKGSNMSRSTSSLNASFSFTATTFTIGGAVHDIQAGDVVSGVTRTIYAISRPKGGAPNCVAAFMLTKQ